MKKILNPIFLPIFVDSCAPSTSNQLNTGSINECLEGVTTKLFLGLAAYRFDTVTTFKDESVWKAAILAKSIVPLFDVYEVASDNTEATKYETGNFVYTTKKEIKKMVAESYLSLCSHRALKSYKATGYTQVYEATEKGEILGVYDIDGVRVKGQDMSDLDIAIRERPTNDKPSFSVITITYRNFEELEDNGVIVKPTWDPNMLNGIFALQFIILSASSTTITFTATNSCGSNYYNDLSEVDLKLVEADGVTAQSITSLANASNIYTITGTGLVTGLLGTDGVKTIGDIDVEAEQVVVTIV